MIIYFFQVLMLICNIILLFILQKFYLNFKSFENENKYLRGIIEILQTENGRLNSCYLDLILKNEELEDKLRHVSTLSEIK